MLGRHPGRPHGARAVADGHHKRHLYAGQVRRVRSLRKEDDHGMNMGH